MRSPSRKPSKVIVGLLKSSMIPVQHVISDSATEDSQENPGKNGTNGGILGVTKTSLLGRVLRRKGTHFPRSSELKTKAYHKLRQKSFFLGPLVDTLGQVSFDIMYHCDNFKTNLCLNRQV